jgi:hypothetical protein
VEDVLYILKSIAFKPMKLYLLLFVLTFSGSLLLQAGDNEDSKKVTATADPAPSELTSGEGETKVVTGNELPADETVPETTVVILEELDGEIVKEQSVCVCIIDEVLDYTAQGRADFRESLGKVRRQIDRLRHREFFSEEAE